MSRAAGVARLTGTYANNPTRLFMGSAYSSNPSVMPASTVSALRCLIMDERMREGVSTTATLVTFS